MDNAREDIPEESQSKVVRITYEYEDGSVREAVGDDAEAINQHIIAAETMNFVHGMQYGGPCLREIKPPRK